MRVVTKHVSVDIETWGKKAGYDIRSIGAVAFNPRHNWVDLPHNNLLTGEQNKGLFFYASCDNPLMGLYSKDHHTEMELDSIGGQHRRYNLKRDPETVAWWHADAQKEVALEAFKNPIDLKQALIEFSKFILDLSDDVRDGQAHDICVWSHGAAFDPPMLVAACEACGVKWPLFYRSPRDTRTIFDSAGIDDHSEHLKKHRYGSLHHALNDAITQALALNDAKQIILGWQRKANQLNTILNSVLDESPTEADLEITARFYSSRLMGSSKSVELEKLKTALSDDNAAIDSALLLFMQHRLVHEKVLQNRIETINRKATDRKYMLNAMYELLGPKAKQVVDNWIAQGVARTSTTWGPEAMNMTGEERAQVLLDFESAPKTKMVDFDRSLSTTESDESSTKGD